MVVDKEQHLYDKRVAAPLYSVACRVLTNFGSVVRAAKLLTKLGCQQNLGVNKMGGGGGCVFASVGQGPLLGSFAASSGRRLHVTTKASLMRQSYGEH